MVRFLLIFILAFAISAFAESWLNYYGQNEIRDVAKTKDGTLWAALAWGLQEQSANKQIKSYTPGNGGLETSDFVQIFALNSGDVIAVSRNGTLVRKNKNSYRFETINNSFVERKRNVLRGLGQIAENILVLPFNGAVSFFDYNTNRSVITLTQIGEHSLEEYEIKRIAVKGDSIWIDLDSFVWKRRINWNEIHLDNYLANSRSWIAVEDKKIPVEEELKPEYTAVMNFSLERVRTISVSSNSKVIAWGNDYSHFSIMRSSEWEGPFWANTSGYGDDQNNYQTKSLAILNNGDFAFGWWGAGLTVFSGNFPATQQINWFHSVNSNNTCPTAFNNTTESFTLVQGVAPSPNSSGFIFSYVSEDNYGLGFFESNGVSAKCKKPEEASSAVAFSVISRENESGEWEIYVAWKGSLESNTGGVDFYKVSPSENFSPVLYKKWSLDSPIDFAFDSKGILWAVSQSKIFYLDKNDDEWKEPSSIRGFDGGTISALETDARNGLWIATLGDGAYSFSQIDDSPDSLIAKHYRVKDGLLSETVYDIAIDTVKGRVYFGNELGLSVYVTAQVRSASDYMQSDAPKTIVYPNPFRPNIHNTVTIDYISEKASVYILDSFGKRIRFFKGDDLRGGAVLWDGKNEKGKLVAPGLYYYVARDGKKTVKGKIIVER